MYTYVEIKIGMAPDERFDFTGKVQDKFDALINVRHVEWRWADYGEGRVYQHQFAVGRWQKRDGEWSQIDARSPITESQLPPAVLDALLKAKAGVE